MAIGVCAAEDNDAIAIHGREFPAANTNLAAIGHVDRLLPESATGSCIECDSAADIDASWLEGKSRVGVTAGASAPEVLVTEVVDGLRALGAGEPREMRGRDENIMFSMPRELRIPAAQVD